MGNAGSIRTRLGIIAMMLTMVATACGGGAEDEPADTDQTTTTSGSSISTTAGAPTTTTPTTTTTTTTTAAPTPEAMLLASVDEAGLRPDGADDDALLQLGGTLCAEAAGADPSLYGVGLSPWETSLPVGMFSSQLFPSARPENPSLDAIRFAALSVENLCPENAGVIAASSTEWTQTLSPETVAAGICYRHLGPLGSAGQYQLVVECAEPHNGEVTGVVELDEDTPSPYGEDRDRTAIETASAECSSVTQEYFGASGGAQLGFGTWLVATNSDDWDAGERRASCRISIEAPIMRGSFAGAYEQIQAAQEGLELTVASCTAERFEATITNTSAESVAAVVEFSNYFPTGYYYFVVVDELAAGETTNVSEDFAEPSADTPTDCDRRLVQVVPLP